MKNYKYDIGIAGLWYGQNYGSILTYYSLVNVIRQFNKSVLMLEPPLPDNWYELQKTSHSRIFAEKHYNISSSCNLKSYNKLCNTFLLGSDQVFNPWIYNSVKNFFLLPFVDKNHKKIAYAASFGHKFKNFSKHEKRKIKHCIKNFDFISLRENSGVEIMNNFGFKNTEQVLDPIFLSDISTYENLIKETKPIEKQGYILNYILDPHKNRRDLILKFSEKIGKDYINILDGMSDKFEDNKAKLDLNNILNKPDAQEVLAYYKNSDFVITDSFHGMCLAIIFNKPFIAIKNNRRGVSRFNSLSGLLNITDRLLEDDFNPDNINMDALLKDINYDSINNVLNKEKIKSINWLKTAIEAPSQKHKISLYGFILDKYYQSGIEYNYILPLFQYLKCSLLKFITFGKLKEHYLEKSARLYEIYKSETKGLKS